LLAEFGFDLGGLGADRGHGGAFTRAQFLGEHFSEITDQLRAKPHAACLSLAKDAPGRASGVAFGMADGEHFVANRKTIARGKVRQGGDGE
jgi:hypothetical protein